MHLAKRLNEELAQQGRREGHTYGTGRATSPDTEPRSKSYDHRTGQSKGKGKMFEPFIIFVLKTLSVFSMLGINFI